MTQVSVIDLPPVFDGIEAVCFDAFGTLVEIAEKRGAVRQLFKAVPPGKRDELKYRLMREPRSISDWMEVYVADADPMMVLDIYARELSEVASVTIRPSMSDIWALLRAKGLRLAVCSNLASSFGLAVRRALPDPPDVVVFSFEVGVIKPEPEIYAHVLDRLVLDPDRVLFVGDSARADIEGSRAAGMKALHVDDLVRVMRPG